MSTPGPSPLSARTAVVTGGSSGIGLETVRGLARLGASVVLVGRGEERSREIARNLAGETGNPSIASVGVRDLGLLSETRTLASRLLAECPRIDILVNNAGAYFRRRETTSEGHERTFALNVLSPFLLTSLLAPRIEASAPARIVNVSSMAHRRRTVDFDHLEGPANWGSGFQVYGASKLELLLLTREFARRFAGRGVTVNAVHPGFVHSGFGQNNPGGTATAIRLFGRVFGRSVEAGAVTPIYAAADPSIAGVTGAYFTDHRVDPGSRASQDLGVARRLYDACRDMTGAPEVVGLVAGSAA